MALLVSDVLFGPQRWINDTAGARWDPTTVLIPHINRGMLEVVNRRPDAYAVRQSVLLTPGKTYQKVLPAESILLVDVPFNTGRDGITPGRKIMKIASTDEMGKSQSNWQTDPNNDGVIVNWIPAGIDTQAFYCYPKAPASNPTYVEVLYSSIPPSVSATGDTIPILPKYRYMLELFVAGNALMQDIPQGDQARGKAYLDLFYDQLKPA